MEVCDDSNNINDINNDNDNNDKNNNNKWWIVMINNDKMFCVHSSSDWSGFCRSNCFNIIDLHTDAFIFTLYTIHH